VALVKVWVGVNTSGSDWYSLKMALPIRLNQLPTQEDVERGLARLCTHALRNYWILDPKGGRALLGLDCVRAHLPGDGTAEKEYALALRAYLEVAVPRVESGAYRTILEIVLGVGDEEWSAKEWRRQKAKARRAKAGQLFRPDEEDGDPVEADTIRQHHEPRALKALAAILIEDEHAVRAATATD
jgi:hypothetical protein